MITYCAASSVFHTTLYADDTYLCLCHKNLDNLQHMVNVELIKVDNRLRSNKIVLKLFQINIYAYKMFEK